MNIMDKSQVKEILSNVKAGKVVSREKLRFVARESGIKQGKNTDELLANVKAFVASVKRGPGRPKADPSKIVGYKVKIGLRYPTTDGTLTKNMREGQLFPTVEAGQLMVDKLLETGKVRLWDGRVRAKFLPRYASK